MRMNWRFLWVVPAVWVVAIATADARTIVIDGSDVDRIAAMTESGPRLSLAGIESAPSVFAASALEVAPGHSALVRFRLTAIPKGMRITNAELILPVATYGGTDPRFYVWRLLAAWGPGVCHLYRQTRPERVAWAMPGARGGASDRSIRPTAVPRLSAAGDLVVNVTDDLELWQAGAAPNHGWLITVEDPGAFVRFPSPAWDGLQSWRLRVTYEPE